MNRDLETAPAGFGIGSKSRGWRVQWTVGLVRSGAIHGAWDDVNDLTTNGVNDRVLAIR